MVGSVEFRKLPTWSLLVARLFLREPYGDQLGTIARQRLSTPTPSIPTRLSRCTTGLCFRRLGKAMTRSSGAFRHSRRPAYCNRRRLRPARRTLYSSATPRASPESMIQQQRLPKIESTPRPRGARRRRALTCPRGGAPARRSAISCSRFVAMGPVKTSPHAVDRRHGFSLLS